MDTEKINRFVVQPVPLQGEGDTRPILGADLLPGLYPNTFICARKASGKSFVVDNMIKNCAGRDTKVLVFCSTLHKDNVWIQNRKWCKAHKIPFEGHTSLQEDGVDLLEKFLNANIQPEEDEEKPKKKKKNLLLLDDEEDEEKKPTKYRAPEWIIVLDDLSTELKSPSLVRFLKMNRHIKAKVIISSQYLHDLAPESRKQIDTFLIFGGMNGKKLEIVYKDTDVGVDFKEFEDMYKKATEQKYSFLYVDTRNDTFRINFDQQFILPK